MPTIKSWLVLTLLQLFLFCSIQAQSSSVSNSFDSIMNKAYQLYTLNRGGNLLLYNGVEYAYSYPQITGHPFFLTDTFQLSTLLYDGILYQDVPLAYNIVTNNVVIKNKNNLLIQLVPEKVGSFLFLNHFFISLTPAIIKKEIIQPGIYEVYNYNAIMVLIKHQKVIQRASNAADLDHFTNYDDYFIKKDDNYFIVKNNDALLTIFGDKSSEIKAYLHQNHLNFKKHPDNAVLKAAAYYAQLKQ